MEEAVTFEIGQKFNSFKEIDDFKRLVEQQQYINLQRRDCKTFESKQKTAPKKVESCAKKEELVYYYLKLCCSFGGKAFKKKGKDKRQTETGKTDCPMHITLSLSDDCQALVVKAVHNEHNHERSKEIYGHLAPQRLLSLEERGEVERMLTLKANKKLVQQTVQQQTGKCITLKDLSNISTRMKASLRSNNLGDLEQLFQEHEGGSTMVLVDEATNSFRSILYQDSYMKLVFAQYPEMLLVDATYKLLDLRMPVYIIMAIDGNGLSEVVAVFIVAEETFVTISSTIEAFTDSNPAASHTKVIMTDKDFTERNALRAHFPNAAFMICLYHVLRTFRREVTIEKMCITSAQRDVCLTVLQKLAYSQSADEYDIHLQELQNLNFERVTAYFLASWHGLKEEWVEGLKNVNMNFGQSTNNRLESLNGKLKSVCSAYSSLRQFFSDLFLVLATLRNERMHKAVLMQVKRPTIDIPEDINEYFVNLTSYAFGIVLKQQQLSLTVQPIAIEENQLSFSSASGNVISTTLLCSCHQFAMTGLPCKHLFHARRISNMPLYADGLYNKRWSRETYIMHCANRCDTSHPHQSVIRQQLSTQRETNVKSQHEKFRQAKQVTDTLATLCSEPGMEVFVQRIKVLENLMDSWKNGYECNLTQNRSAGSFDLPSGSGNAVSQHLVKPLQLRVMPDQQLHADVTEVMNNDDEIGLAQDIEMQNNVGWVLDSQGEPDDSLIRVEQEVQNENIVVRREHSQALIAKTVSIDAQENDMVATLQQQNCSTSQPSETNVTASCHDSTLTSQELTTTSDGINYTLNSEDIMLLSAGHTDSSDEDEEQFNKRILGQIVTMAGSESCSKSVTSCVLLPAPYSAYPSLGCSFENAANTEPTLSSPPILTSSHASIRSTPLITTTHTASAQASTSNQILNPVSFYASSTENPVTASVFMKEQSQISLACSVESTTISRPRLPSVLTVKQIVGTSFSSVRPRFSTMKPVPVNNLQSVATVSGPVSFATTTSKSSPPILFSSNSIGLHVSNSPSIPNTATAVRIMRPFFSGSVFTSNSIRVMRPFDSSSLFAPNSVRIVRSCIPNSVGAPDAALNSLRITRPSVSSSMCASTATFRVVRPSVCGSEIASRPVVPAMSSCASSSSTRNVTATDNSPARTRSHSAHETVSVPAEPTSVTVARSSISKRTSQTPAQVEKLITEESPKVLQDVLNAVIMPPTMRKRGRPKGAEKTVIGLPRKRSATSAKPIPFRKLTMMEKDKKMLCWFVDGSVCENALQGELIPEEEVEVRPNNVSVACLDKAVCVDSLQRYFTSDAWKLVRNVIDQKRKQNVFACPICSKNANESAIICECCLQWFHKQCCGLNKKPKVKDWFCSQCLAK